MREIEFKAFLGEDQVKKLRQRKPSTGLVAGLLAPVALAWIFSAVSLGPAQLEFGSLKVGSDSRLKVKLTNRGLTEFHAASIAVDGDASDFYLDGQQCVTVAAGETCEVWVKFHPLEPGVKLARLMVRTKDGDELSSSFKGEATSGIAPVGPPPQPPTPHPTHPVDPIANPQPLPPVPGPLPAPVNPIPPNVSQQPPPVTKASSPPLPVATHPPTYIPPYQPVSGNTHQPQPTPTPQIQINPRALDFSRPPAGSRQVVVSNYGNGPLGLGFTLAGADHGSFGYDPHACGNVLPAGSQCVVTVRYNPGIDSQERPLRAQLMVNHNASNVASPQTVALSWKPSIPPAHPHVTATPNPVRFTIPAPGTEFSPQFKQTVIVTNDGTVGLKELRVQIGSGGVDQGPFSQTSGCSSSLNPGQSCAVQVGFLPRGAQQYTDQLNVFEGTTQMARVNLQASGTRPPPANYTNNGQTQTNQPPPGNAGTGTRPPGSPQSGTFVGGRAGNIDPSNGGSGQPKAPAPADFPKYEIGGQVPPQANSGTKQKSPAPAPSGSGANGKSNQNKAPVNFPKYETGQSVPPQAKTGTNKKSPPAPPAPAKIVLKNVPQQPAKKPPPPH